MYRTKTCGELRLSNVNEEVTLAGWVQRSRKMGGMTFVDLRDRYGITQLVFNEETDADLCAQANKLGREYVIQVVGRVSERYAKNDKIPTGEIEIIVSSLTVLNASDVPPFTIEENTDGGDDLRMKYRYLDLRRSNVRANLELRHKFCLAVRHFLDSKGFLEIETPVLVGSTPEGARDFIVPSRMNPGQFYALPQSPQTLKQLLMVAGMDRYFQIVKCFRDEDLRADRQPEFTQIDCEMSFVEQDDIISLFEEMAKHLFKEVRGDAVGSSLGLADYLRSLGKIPQIIMPNAFPDFLRWMPGSRDIMFYDGKETEAKAKINEADLIFMLDFCALDRLQNMQEAVAHSKCKRIMIDHHLNPDRKAASLVISHPQACSCEIVFRLIWQMGGYEQMTRSGAACIYTGMMTDTGSFTYASKRPEIYYIIGQLLQKGIDKDKIYRNVNNNYSENRLRFVGYVLNSKLKFYENQKASIFTITREEMTVSYTHLTLPTNSLV